MLERKLQAATSGGQTGDKDGGGGDGGDNDGCDGDGDGRCRGWKNQQNEKLLSGAHSFRQ